MNAETAVLGAVMVSDQAYWRVADLLVADDFSSGESRRLWEVVCDLYRQGMAADPVTVADRVPALSAFALSAANVPCSTTNARAYAELVVQKATERRVNAAGRQMAALKGVDALMEAQALLGSCVPKNSGAVRPIRDFLRESVMVMQQRCDATEVLTGVPTSLPWLDEQTAGWQRGDLIILAARPSLGKTALALQCALHAAEAGNGLLFFSLEQSGAQIADRAMAHVSRVSLQSILQPKRIEEHEWARIGCAGKTIGELPLLIDETGALAVDSICARARQANADKRLGLIVIDYLTQIMPPKADKMADAVQMITRQLKALAKALSVPVMLLSQLNRKGDEKPHLTHLRDSGAIEQDADVVLFLHRPDENKADLVELTIAKQRNGVRDVHRYLRADMAHMRFIETDDVPTVATVSRARGFGRYRKHGDAAA